MKYLTGSYNHTVDAKNRIRIPSKIREDMFGPDFKDEKFSVYFRPGKGGCVSIYTPEVVDQILDKISSIKECDDENYMAAAFFAGSFRLVESDPQGRLVIPSDMLKAAQIKDDIIISGNINHVDIWAPHIYAQFKRDLQDVIKQLGL